MPDFSPFLYGGFTTDILRLSGKVSVHSEWLQMLAQEQQIKTEDAFKILLISS
jgi:hypothetical protein